MNRRIVVNGLRYFAIVFLLGFALGTLRVLLLVPRLGEAIAELVEIPVMLACIAFIARWQVRVHTMPVKDWLQAGGLALMLLLAFEFTVVLAVRGLSLEAWLASRDPIAFTAYLLALAAYAVMPAMLARPR